MQNLPLFDRPLTIGEILDRSFHFYRKNIGLLLLTAAVLIIPFGIVSGLLVGQAEVRYIDLLDIVSRQQVEPNTSFDEILGTQFQPLWVFARAMFFVVILESISGGITYVALTYQEIGVLHGKKIPLGESLLVGISRLLDYIGMMLLQFAAFFGILIGIILVFGCAIAVLFMSFGGEVEAFGRAFASGFGGSESPATAMIGVSIGVLCLYTFAILLILFPISYFFGRWSVVLPALVDQRLGPIEALRYSWNLTKGHVRRSIIFVILLIILSIIIVSVPVYIITEIATLFLLGRNRALVESISPILTSLFSIIWIPLGTIASIIYYYDLRVRKEGFDLSQRIDKLESNLNLHSSLLR